MTLFRIQVCLCLLALGTLAQTPTSQQTTEQQSTVQESTTQAIPVPAKQPGPNQIRLNVVVNDKSGKPVPNLQQDDFTVLDNKRPQPILSFEAVGGSSTSRPPVEIVIVVDAINTAFTRVAYERSELDKFLKRDGGRLAFPVQVVFATDSGLVMEHEPSRDGNAVDDYLDQHVLGLRAVNRSQGFYGAVDRLRFSLDALNRLAQAERTRPGRKLVIWISPGWPLISGPRVQLTPKQEQQIFQTIVGLTAELPDSGITLYSVDPLGTSDAGGLRTFYYQEFVKGVKSWRQALFGNLALQVIVVHSGGRVLNSNNDIAAEVETCVRDADYYYVLSINPQPADGPDDYHQIEVKLSSHDLKAQTLSEYYAQPPGR